MPRIDQWTDDQLTVLMALFVAQPFGAGDDSDPRNEKIARAIGRERTAIDRQWRNIKYCLFRLDLMAGRRSAGKKVARSNVGQNVWNIVDEYRVDLRKLRNDAEKIIAQNGWRGLKRMLGK